MPKKFNTVEERRAYWKQWYERNKRRPEILAKEKLTKKRVRGERREWFIEYKKQLKCEKCNISDYRVLDFHHKDPSTKKLEVSTMSSKYSNETVLQEIEKCKVLCANCHRIDHWEEKNIKE